MLKSIGRILRPALVLLIVFVILGVAGVAYQGVRTLQRLTAVEAERDQWQEPAAILRHLDLKEGSVVVDLGSGAGYFALKLSDAVGATGRVIAVDLRRLSLEFLRTRAFLQGKRNIQIVVGDIDDPHLVSTVDAMLIANTYHELTQPQAILRHARQALRPEGRLVIVDRLPPHRDDTHPEDGHFHSAPDAVQSDLQAEGFHIITRDDTFIRPAGDEPWWLIVASK